MIVIDYYETTPGERDRWHPGDRCQVLGEGLEHYTLTADMMDGSVMLIDARGRLHGREPYRKLIPVKTSDAVFHAAQTLSQELAAIPGLPLAPAVVGADPTDYLADHFRAYLERAASGPRRCVIVGMNPSPHGMAQNGVPFGDTRVARRILAPFPALQPDACGPFPDIAGPGVAGPDGVALPVRGLAYARGEESGHRLWGLLDQLCGGLDAALSRCLVINYCPLVFLDSEGRNVALGAWPRRAEPVRALEDACDAWLRAVCDIVRAEHVVGVGMYATGALERALSGSAGPSFSTIRHPSPLAGSAQSWASAATPVLALALGVP